MCNLYHFGCSGHSICPSLRTVLGAVSRSTFHLMCNIGVFKLCRNYAASVQLSFSSHIPVVLRCQSMQCVVTPLAMPPSQGRTFWTASEWIHRFMLMSSSSLVLLCSSVVLPTSA